MDGLNLQHEFVAAVILDFDGVVVDSLEAHLTAWSEAHRRVFGRPVPDPGQLRGLSTRVIANLLAEQAGDPGHARTLAAIKDDCLLTGSVPVPWLNGAREFLEYCWHAGIPLGIASNSKSKFVRGLLAQLECPGEWVQAVIGADNVGKIKPHPDPYLACARQLSISMVSFGRTWVFDDSPHGVKAGCAAGMRVIGITSACTPGQLLAAGAELTHSDLGAVLASHSRTPPRV